MQKIEHIGIAVADLQKSIPIFEKLLGTPCYKTEAVESENVITAFFKIGESKIELVAPSSPESVIQKFIDKKGEGMHHIAFDVPDIDTEMIRLKNEGFAFINEVPKAGADNKTIAFLHPKSTNGLLVELCMENPS